MIERTAIPQLCQFQAEWCERLGSPLYAYLLRCCADDYEQNGPVRQLLEPHTDDPRGSALALRMMGAVHRLALAGKLPELARFYPSCGGTVALEPAWRVFRHVIAEQMELLQKLVLNPVQTNEIGRCGPLLGGFLLISRHTRMPLRLLEIGASAGLNLNWMHYRYTWPGGAWGDPASPVVLQDVFAGDRVPPVSEVTVAERAGCDPTPVNPASQQGRLTLRSYIWADQLDRMRILEQAIAVAHRYPVHLDRAQALDWLTARLAEPASGVATVLFHSVVWQYINREERQGILELMERTAAQATASSPVAWLRMEPGKDGAEVRLRISSRFEDQMIATAGFHKPQTVWLGERE